MEKTITKQTIKTRPRLGRKRNSRKRNGKNKTILNQVDKVKKQINRLAKQRVGKSGRLGSALIFKGDQPSLRRHMMNILDPWEAKNAKLPNSYEIYSRASKVKSSFTLLANAGGNLLAAFDPDYLSSTGVSTTFMYNNSSGLNGTAINTFTWNSVVAGGQPVCPTATFTKARLVSAGIVATVKLSALNIVGTAFTCIAYENSNLVTSGLIANTAGNADMDNYQNFTNIENGPGGKKFDITDHCPSVNLIWKPVDPLSLTFLAPGGEIMDNVGKEAGAYQKFIIAFSGLAASAPILFDVVENWELVTYGSATAWVGGTLSGVPSNDIHSNTLDLGKNIQRSEELEAFIHSPRFESLAPIDKRSYLDQHGSLDDSYMPSRTNGSVYGNNIF